MVIAPPFNTLAIQIVTKVMMITMTIVILAIVGHCANPKPKKHKTHPKISKSHLNRARCLGLRHETVEDGLAMASSPKASRWLVGPTGPVHTCFAHGDFDLPYITVV